MKYLLAVVSGIGTTHKVLIGPAIQVWVFSTNETISCITRPTLTLVHRVTEVADVDAFGIFVTVVGLVLAWVLWLAHLEKKQRDYKICHHIQHGGNCDLSEKEVRQPFMPILLSTSDDMSKHVFYYSL